MLKFFDNYFYTWCYILKEVFPFTIRKWDGASNFIILLLGLNFLSFIAKLSFNLKLLLFIIYLTIIVLIFIRYSSKSYREAIESNSYPKPTALSITLVVIYIVLTFYFLF